MAIKATINPSQDQPLPTYPLLRLWRDDATDCPKGDGPLIVLFKSEHVGVALSGVHDSRIGASENWRSAMDANWIPCSITLTSKG